MVVTRKAPTAPLPASRTNSSQPVPRLKKPQTSAASNGGPNADDSHSTVAQVHGDDVIDSSKKGKQKSKDRCKRKDKKTGNGFVELLTRAFILWFTIYTLSVCPTDEDLKSPVCRGLSEYRRLILEPYIVPAFHRALAHPTVAPYVERVQPYAERAYNIAKPIALRSQSEFNNRVVPQFKKHIVPQWNNHVVPLWNQHAAPHVQRVEQQLQPYLVRAVYEYQHRLEPRLQLVVNNLQRWQRQAQPYVILAANKTYVGYQKAKPYAIPVWEQVKVLLSRLAQFLAVQRRQYVDPHVKKIWERVIELSGGAKPTPVFKTQTVRKTPVSFSAKSASASSVASSVSSSRSSLVSQASEAATASPSSEITAESESLLSSVAPETTSTPLPSQAQETLSVMSSVVSSSAQDTASAVSSDVVSAVSSVSISVSSATASVAPSAKSFVEESILSPVSSATPQVDLSSSASPPTETPSALSSSVSEVTTETSSSSPSPTPSRSPVSDDDIDLDAFYAELGLDEDGETTATDEAPAPEETESEEEIAERKRLRDIKTAEKRAALTKRHEEWEQKVEESIATNENALKKGLIAIRKAATAELKSNVEIRKELESLEEDAEKYLRGAEKYLANLKRESRREDEKRTMWTRVVDKVDEKFEQRLTQADAIVSGWYQGVLNKEGEEVKKVTEEVKDLAERAQADIGLDYAWLDDVTYEDWQRYHDLVRRSETFTTQAYGIQNGTDVSVPANPVLAALEELQSEVHDTVLGFQTRLRRINRHGERSFSAKDGEDPIDDEIALDDSVNIQPIEDDAHKAPANAETPVEIPPVIIGKSKEQVVEAFNRVAEQEISATSTPEAQTKNSETIVEEVAQQVEEEAQTSTSPAHEEL
ncbi:hypothetical protein QCA50_009002 [Cerrena zonata]|uniref:Uncharacterized protein n=1 Tax=Cerrena zonata TaxID=2478898 RepID=A0AAW0GCW1_9APHY